MGVKGVDRGCLGPCLGELLNMGPDSSAASHAPFYTFIRYNFNSKLLNYNILIIERKGKERIGGK